MSSTPQWYDDGVMGVDDLPDKMNWGMHCVTWLAFFAVWLFAWEGALPAVFKRLGDELDIAYATPGGGVRRGYLIALAAYAIALAWLNMAFLFLITLFLCVLSMVALNGFDFIEDFVPMLRPSVVLDCVALPRFAFHGAAAAAMLLAASLSVGFYVTDEDLEDADATHAKATRAIMTAASIGFIAYGAFALSRIFGVG